MKKLLMMFVVLCLSLGLFACGKKTEEAPVSEGGDNTEAKVFKVAVLLPFVGDQSYFDTLNEGRLKAEEMFENVETKLIEVDPSGTAEEAKWMDAFDEVCESGEFDLVVSGNNTYEQFLYKAAEKYPDQKFLNFDVGTLPEKLAPNTYYVNYALDDLGYVVGTLSAAITKTNKVGVVVGMDNKGMNQFISGWTQILAEKGVQYMIYYPGSFTDTALGKEGTKKLIDKGVDVVWQVAGGLGNGVIEACSEAEGVWCIGVDQDQHLQFKESKPEWANSIITSALKKTDEVLVRVVEMLINGELDSKLGTNESWGINENGVGIAENDYYLENTTEEIRNEVTATLDEVKAGKVQVIDCLEWDDETYNVEWPKLRDSNRIE